MYAQGILAFFCVSLISYCDATFGLLFGNHHHNQHHHGGKSEFTIDIQVTWGINRVLFIDSKLSVALIWTWYFAGHHSDHHNGGYYPSRPMDIHYNAGYYPGKILFLIFRSA